MSFKRILSAVDFSEPSTLAFDQAVELAERFGAALFVLHALEVQPLVSQWMAPDGLSELIMEIEGRAKEAMESLENSVRERLDRLTVHTEITSGRAFIEILENARVWDADLIVMGARGVATSLEEVVMGSTAERVLKEAECSVLVVKG
jgi:nucleotide-binding universal stress UspA family protein